MTVNTTGIGGARPPYRFRLESLKEGEIWEDLSVDGRMIFKHALRNGT